LRAGRFATRDVGVPRQGKCRTCETQLDDTVCAVAQHVTPNRKFRVTVHPLDRMTDPPKAAGVI
jgi:hypothetical protein